ncbi:hypothetical protein HHK36_001240 [Tetracentron sinense]|uniref:Timeless N-terminal domain-containing protein n=1 Tax=Tetracentron sinense TaxID=13715 RepID=A0A834ZSJ3_TETSI|nr:hypothetical protein HHK36_001240 [Tetracentron sinense]
MDLEGLSTICAGLGLVEEDEHGARIGYSKSEFCLDNLKDLLRFLRRDDPQTRDVFKQVCKWNTVSKDLIPIIEHCQDDRNLVINAVKVLVFLTMPIDSTSNDISQQIEYLWGLKSWITRCDTIAVIVSLLEDPLQNLERDTFTEDDWKLVQLVLTLFRNILAVQDISLQQKASGSATQFLSLRDRFLEIIFHENVMDLILVLTQHIGGSCGYLRQDNLLLLDTFHYIFLGQEPELIAKASQKGNKVEDVKASLNSLRSIMEEEEEKRRLTKLRNLDRYSQFSGTFTRISMDGSKTLHKGNPGTTRDILLKPHKVQRGQLKRTAWDHGRLSSSKDNILELLHDFVNQFLSGGYNVLMKSIREDIEKEHHAIQNSDVVVFFQVAQFVTAFQHHKFLISKPMETGTSEAFVNKYADTTLFQGDICGPIAATMNESMFLLVISKWRIAFDSLKETNDHKFLSPAGCLVKNMIRMLDLVLKKLPGDSKEPQTARILLYKLFYDQTDQGMTQFLLNLIKSFDSHKQPKSDLADLVEIIHVVVRLMENLQTRGTLRTAALVFLAVQNGYTDPGVGIKRLGFLEVSRKARKARKKKISRDSKETVEKFDEDNGSVQNEISNSTCEPSIDLSMPLKKELINSSSDGKEENVVVPAERFDEDDVSVQNDIGNSTCKPSIDLSMALKKDLINSTSDGKEENVVVPDQIADPEIPLPDAGNFGDESMHMDDRRFSHSLDDMVNGTSDSSNDDLAAATDEIDFKASSLVATFANNTIIQNLCWLLKFYKNNSTSTNHYIICMLRRICDDLELSPMLYQLSLLNTFYDILVEQKSSPCKEYANIVSFLTNLVRKMLRKMKSQPLLFVEALFWKTRKECHYISSEALLHELGNLRKEYENWGSASGRDEEEIGSSQGKGGIYKRSIADSLGEDEADFVISHELSYQKEQDPDEAKLQKVLNRTVDSVGEVKESMASVSNSEIDGEDNSDLSNPHNDGHSPEHESKRASKRKKRLVFDDEVEKSVKNLYEKYKDNRLCSRLIAESLFPSGKVSPVQVSRMLKRLGLRVASKKRILHLNVPEQPSGEGEALDSDATLLNLNGMDDGSWPKRSFHTRKRIHAFSKEQEMMVKDLFEEFKDHKRCSYMIANALDADKTFTVAQISRKLKQLGLHIPQQKRPCEAKKHSRDDDPNSLCADKIEEGSDEETLLALKKRNFSIFPVCLRPLFEINVELVPKKKEARASLEKDMDSQFLDELIEGELKDDEALVYMAIEREPWVVKWFYILFYDSYGTMDGGLSVLVKTGRRLLSIALDEKLTTSTVQEMVIDQNDGATGVPQDVIERGAHSISGEMAPSHVGEDMAVKLKDLNGNSKQEEASSATSSGKPVGAELLNNIDHVPHQQMHDELEDSEDDVAQITPKTSILRRKLKMVVDLEDDE